MDSIPSWAQVALASLTIGSGVFAAYWRSMVRLAALELKQAALEAEVASDMRKIEETHDQLLKKSDARDKILTDHGNALTKLTAQLEILLPQFTQGIADINAKLDRNSATSTRQRRS